MAYAGSRRALLAQPFKIANMFQGGLYNGFYFDFTVGATGSAIASVTSQPPPTTTAAQGTSGSRPTWNSAGYASFDGIDDFLLSTLGGAGTITLGLCARPTSTTTYRAIGARTGTTRLALSFASGKVAAAAGNNQEATITGGATYTGADVVSVLRVTPSVVDLYANGQSIYTGAFAGSVSTNQLGVGAAYSGSAGENFFAGRIYRAFAIYAALGNVQVVQLSRALGAGIISF